eukprot:TRINITY_DN10684_c0_g1_i1.p1 TRINITY_DN10684_c0_g1~~TRINITY_DN10684_c0_g1_i1.p1  ORF type:complete len:521 (-),score=88.29 TRINITY_DN10684_c0_g1_i1:234-1796(-)
MDARYQRGSVSIDENLDGLSRLQRQSSLELPAVQERKNSRQIQQSPEMTLARTSHSLCSNTKSSLLDLASAESKQLAHAIRSQTSRQRPVTPNMQGPSSLHSNRDPETRPVESHRENTQMESKPANTMEQAYEKPLRTIQIATQRLVNVSSASLTRREQPQSKTMLRHSWSSIPSTATQTKSRSDRSRTRQQAEPRDRQIPASRDGPSVDRSARHRMTKAYSGNSYNSSDPFVYWLAGPILITAPHSLRLIRGGQNGERRRIHRRERWVSEIVVKLASALQNACGLCPGFMIWNLFTARTAHRENLDPNYLTKSQLSQSPWHEILIKFRARFPKGPLMHVDIHGKMDRKDNLDLDLGMEPMNALWPQQDFVCEMRDSLANGFLQVLKDVRRATADDPRTFGVELDPDLCGFWGFDSFHTMTHQAVLLGIPSCQLEVPFSMRKVLCSDPDTLHGFAIALHRTFMQVVVPFYGQSSALGSPYDSLSLNVETNCPHRRDYGQVVSEMIRDLEEFDRKSVEVCI